MINKKKIIDIISSILIIVIMLSSFITSCISIDKQFTALKNGDYGVEYYGTGLSRYKKTVVGIFMTSMLIDLLIVAICVAVIFIKQSSERSKKVVAGLNISVVAFIFLINAVKNALTTGVYAYTWLANLNLAMIVFTIVAIPLKIVALCVGDERLGEGEKETGLFKSKKGKSVIENKINELKHLKELGVIDEEQYQTAIEKVIKDIA